MRITEQQQQQQQKENNSQRLHPHGHKTRNSERRETERQTDRSNLVPTRRANWKRDFERDIRLFLADDLTFSVSKT